MRDPNRIPTILNLLREYWEANPDLRLGQIIGNIHHGDPFYVEDDVIELGLRETIARKEKYHVGKVPFPFPKPPENVLVKENSDKPVKKNESQ